MREDIKPIILLSVIKKYFYTESSNEQHNRNFSCRTNPRDNGIAAIGEFPHVALVIGKIFNRNSRINKFVYDTKCAGSLVTKFHLITSVTCVNTSRHTHASIKFGVSLYDEYNGTKSDAVVLRENFMARNQLTLLKLPSEIQTNELIFPINLPSIAFEHLSNGKLILAGWTGYKYECNQQMSRKWFIQRDAFKSCGNNLICLSEADIVNYREVRDILNFNEEKNPITCAQFKKGIKQNVSSFQ